MKIFKRVLRIIISVTLIAFAVSFSISSYIHYSQKNKVYTLETIPSQRVALVFGAAVRSNGTLSAILDDRVSAATSLYTSGRVEKILMSGDNSSTDYDEVNAMKKAAIAKGVKPEDIVLDYAGFSTYESCYRAKEIFGLEKVILITQRYHLDRALFTCNQLGIEATGVALDDFEKYPNLRVSYTLREFFALNKAWFEIELLHPKPTFLGKFEGPI